MDYIQTELLDYNELYIDSYFFEIWKTYYSILIIGYTVLANLTLKVFTVLKKT